MKPYLKTLCVWQYSFVKNTLLCLRLTLLHQFYEFLLRSMAYYFIKIILFLVTQTVENLPAMQEA